MAELVELPLWIFLVVTRKQAKSWVSGEAGDLVMFQRQAESQGRLQSRGLGRESELMPGRGSDWTRRNCTTLHDWQALSVPAEGGATRPRS